MNEANIDAFLDTPALAGLSTADKDGIAGLLKTPARGEFFFFLQLVGKSPAQVGNIIVEEAIHRFPSGKVNPLTDSTAFLSSWKEVMDTVEHFAALEDGQAPSTFWANMRHVIAALPKRDGYSAGDSSLSRGPVQPSHVWNYGTCKHCWRRVAHNAGLYRKTASYCHVHNLPSSHPLYRKHSRLARDLPDEQQAVLERIDALVRYASSAAEAQDMLYESLTTENDCLPHVGAYLNEAGHDGTPEGLLWAFHGPSSAITDREYSAALERYIHYVLNASVESGSNHPHPIFSHDELSRAEAWLTLLNKNGRRQ